MKKIYFLLSLLTMMLSCSSTDELNDNSPVVLDDDQIIQPIVPTVKLPKEINYIFSNNFDNEIYKSDNFYTYDSLNRITKITIKSFFNNEVNIDYDYKIIYNDTTSFAKGFIISIQDYQNNLQTNKFVKLKYVVNPNSSNSPDNAYYNYVNNEAEINSNEFVIDEGKKVTGKFDVVKNIFFPNNCGSNLLENPINKSEIYYYRDS